MDDQKKPVNEKFSAILKALDTNPYQIAQKLNLKRPDKYYRVEKGIVNPSFDIMEEIVSLYPQLNINYFFKEKEPMFVDEVSISKSNDELLHIQVKHLQQKVSLLETQNQELLTQLLKLKEDQSK